jgi:16S rRNA (cytosine1402-N4)-methyltransferase
LQDRIVKRAFLAAAGRPYVEEDHEIAYSTSGVFVGEEAPTPVVKILTKKPVVTSKEEAKVNSRSRSAKLRVVEKL